MTGEPVEKLLVLVERSKDGALTPEDVDVADKAAGGVARFLVSEVKIKPEVVEFIRVLLLVERPGIAFGGEDRGARGIEGAKSVHQRGMELGFRKMVEIIGIFAKVDEAAVPGRVRWIRPGNDKDGIFSGGFDGPFSEHQCLS
jgi:hypothetical protein